VLSRVLREGRLSSKHLQETTQSTQERDFARLAIFLGLPAAEFGQQLHFDSVKAHAQVEEKARATHPKATNVRMPCQSNTCTSSHPRQVFKNLKQSSTLQHCRYIVKMRTPLWASSTGQSVSRSQGSPSTPNTRTSISQTSRMTCRPDPLRRTLPW